MKIPQAVLLTGLMLAGLVQNTYGALQKRSLNLTWELGAPNGQARDHIKTNGQFPSPPLYFDEGDDVEVTVHNFMHQNTTIHWHGLLQKETPWSDGVPGLSQKPIEPGQSYIYRFKAWPPGQYWYHSHSRATLLDGLYGPLLIRRKSGSPNPFSLISKDPKDIDAMETAANNPVIIMPSDWDYYNSSQYKEADANSRLQLFCVDSILINGKGSLFCPPHEWLKERQIPFMKASWPNDDITDKGCFPFVPATEGPWLREGNASALPEGIQSGCKPHWGDTEVIEVDPAARWASINWIGAATFKTLQPTIDEHEMWIYEVDGHFIEPRRAHSMLLWAGERYSAMIKLDKKPMDYSIRVIDGGYSQMIGSFGILRYKGGEVAAAEPDMFNVTTTSRPYYGYNAWPVADDRGNYPKLLDKEDIHPFPPKAPSRHADAMHVLKLGKANSTWEFTLSGTKKYPSDRSAYNPLLYDLNSPDARDDDLIIRTKNGTWQDIVLQVGGSELWPVDFPHAIHKHASKYWKIGMGQGLWNYNSVEEAVQAEPDSFNLENPPYRDTFLSEFTGAMWVVLRYFVDAPGAWMLHCHFEMHLDNGMAMAILDGIDAWPEVPPEYKDGFAGFKEGSDLPSIAIDDDVLTPSNPEHWWRVEGHSTRFWIFNGALVCTALLVGVWQAVRAFARRRTARQIPWKLTNSDEEQETLLLDEKLALTIKQSQS